MSDRTGTGSLLDNLLSVAPLIPIVAALGTIGFLLIQPPSLADGATEPLAWMALVWGLVLAGTFCVVASVGGAIGGNRAAKRRNSRSAAELRLRLAELKDRLVAADGVKEPAVSTKAVSEVRDAYDFIATALGLRLYSGDAPDAKLRDSTPDFPALFDRLHEAEAAIIAVEPATNVLGDAQYDHLRLTGSSIDSAAELQRDIETAIAALVAAKQLSANALTYVTPVAAAAARPPSNPAPAGSAVNSASAGSSTSGAPSSSAAAPTLPVASGAASAGGTNIQAENAPVPTDEDVRAMNDARTSLRMVRNAIEQYRNDRYAGLSRLGRQLHLIGFSAGFATLLLLALAIAANAPRSALVGAAAVYVVGAGVGLFSRLYTGSAADTAIKDYGLTTARVLTTPVVSGIAAVVGVLLTGYVTVGFNPMSYQVVTVTSATTTSTATASSTSRSQSPSLALRPLSEVYDLSLFPFDLVIAAIFGFAPKLALDNLQQKADKYMSELQSSQPTDGGAKAPAKPSK